MTATLRATEDDLSDLAFWSLPPARRLEAFARLRERESPAFFPRAQAAVHQDRTGLLRARPARGRGGGQPDAGDLQQRAVLQQHRRPAPVHGPLLRLDDQHGRPAARQDPPDRVAGVHPRVLAKLDADLETTATRIVDDLRRKGSADFVTDVAARLPVQVICDMMGIPERVRPMVYDRTNIILGLGDPEYTGGKDFNRDGITRIGVLYGLLKAMTAGYELNHLAMKLARRAPQVPRRRPGVAAGVGQRGRGVADRPGDRVVLHPARRRRQRDDPQRHDARAEAAHRQS
ncbi:hypothetical protein [Actinomadura madurae]|uniref:hypothetical protein n=1 Tax=Actinomadura madurae TaxID=1993 RepID=UPI003556EB92